MQKPTELTEKDIRFATRLAVGEHVVLVALLWSAICFLGPVFGEMYADGSHFPAATLWVFDSADFLKSGWGFLLFALFIVATWKEAKRFSWLVQRYGFTRVHLLARVMSWTLLGLIFWTFIALILPLLRWGNVAY